MDSAFSDTPAAAERMNALRMHLFGESEQAINIPPIADPSQISHLPTIHSLQPVERWGKYAIC